MKVKCCRCGKEYDLEDNIFERDKDTNCPILICPYCDLKHAINFMPFEKEVDVKKAEKLDLTTLYPLIGASRIANASRVDQSGADDGDVTDWVKTDDFILAIRIYGSKGPYARAYKLKYRQIGGVFKDIALNALGFDIHAAPNTDSWLGMAWSPSLGIFCMTSSTGTQQVATSPDGYNWTLRDESVGTGWYHICWSPELSLFVALAYNNDPDTVRIMTSPNGIDWTSRTSPSDQRYSDICWSADKSLFVVVCATTPKLMMASPDGINWTNYNSSWETVMWTCVEYSPSLGLFVSLNGSNASHQLQTSTNGTSWTLRVLASGYAPVWRDVCWSPEKSLFVAVANDAVASNYRVATSSNGTTWTLRTSPVYGWNQVRWCPEIGLFVATSDTSYKIMTSPNGTTWTLRDHPCRTQRMAWSPSLEMLCIAGASSGFISTSFYGEIAYAAAVTDLVDGNPLISTERICDVQGGYTWQDGLENEGDNLLPDAGTFDLLDEYYTELQWALSCNDAEDEAEYEFELWDVTEGASVGTCLATITMAAAAVEGFKWNTKTIIKWCGKVISKWNTK